MDIPTYPDSIFNIKRHYNCDKNKKNIKPQESDDETIKKQIKYLINDLNKCLKRESRKIKKK